MSSRTKGGRDFGGTLVRWGGGEGGTGAAGSPGGRCLARADARVAACQVRGASHQMAGSQSHGPSVQSAQADALSLCTVRGGAASARVSFRQSSDLWACFWFSACVLGQGAVDAGRLDGRPLPSPPHLLHARRVRHRNSLSNRPLLFSRLARTPLPRLSAATFVS